MAMPGAASTGIDLPRVEIVRFERDGSTVRASGTQLGATYELRYELADDRLLLEVVGERTADVDLDRCDFFDLGYSPFFNSLPIWRDGLVEEGPGRDFVMRWISVPELEVDESHQRYEPLGARKVRFRSGSFAAEISYDEDGLVLRYEGLAERVA